MLLRAFPSGVNALAEAPLAVVAGGCAITLGVLAFYAARGELGAVIDALGDRTFTLVANLPYQVASPLMGTLLIEHPRCLGLYITIQREVADRIVDLA